LRSLQHDPGNSFSARGSGERARICPIVGKIELVNEVAESNVDVFALFAFLIEEVAPELRQEVVLVIIAFGLEENTDYEEISRIFILMDKVGFHLVALSANVML
jgi:hypothetical protein